MKSKDHISNERKEEIGDNIISFLLLKNPELKAVQIRRILCYNYQRLRGRGINIVKKIKRSINS